MFFFVVVYDLQWRRITIQTFRSGAQGWVIPREKVDFICFGNFNGKNINENMFIVIMNTDCEGQKMWQIVVCSSSAKSNRRQFQADVKSEKNDVCLIYKWRCVTRRIPTKFQYFLLLLSRTQGSFCINFFEKWIFARKKVVHHCKPNHRWFKLTAQAK